MERERDRPGRKAQPANRGERASLGLKVGAGIKARLEAAARENGRTQSQEAEARLENSFRQEDLLTPALRLAYGPEVAGMLLIVAREFARSGRIGAVISQDGDPEARQRWQTDPFAYDQAVKAVIAVLETFRPSGNPVLPAANEDTAKTLERHAERSVAITLAAIKDPNWSDQFQHRTRNRELEQFAAEVRDLLGPELIACIPSDDRKEW